MPPPLKNGGGGGAADKKKNGALKQPPPASSASASTTNNASQDQPEQLGDQMDHILQLLNRRVRGEATTEQIESAVDQVLDSMNIERPSESAATAAAPQRPPLHEETPIIQEDTENYDDDDEEEEKAENDKGDSKPAAESPQEDEEEKKEEDDCTEAHEDNGKGKKGRKRKAKKDPKGPKKKVGRKRKNALPTPEELAWRDTISQIPMGTEAAKMMTTFGDGKMPLPEALEATLMGTRKTLQMAIMDARKVRRRMQQDFQDAKNSVDPRNHKAALDKKRRAEKAQRDKEAAEKAKGKKNGDDDDGSDSDDQKKKPTVRTDPEPLPNILAVDPKMMYRALQEGHDKLAVDHKCGFHLEELEHLFPEEMKAYHRWIDMHEQYNESKADGKEKLKEKAGEDDEDADNDDAKDEKSPIKGMVEDFPEGGYLKERLSAFDFRTYRMQKEWYLEFAKVRAGSFLPNTMRVRKTQVEKDWDAIRKKQGKHAAGAWENITARSVRFLHWLGFDPPNLFPPDEDTTQALAFLAYDRFGRIVEKAIYLRNLEALQKKKKQIELDKLNGVERSRVDRPLWELPQGVQLSKEDIDRAMEDPGIKPAAVFGSEDTAGHSSIQLYFGPGWEDRLELEMEEFVASTQGSDAQVSEEERAFREQEVQILEKISAPPINSEDALKKLVADRKSPKKKDE